MGCRTGGHRLGQAAFADASLAARMPSVSSTVQRTSPHGEHEDQRATDPIAHYGRTHSGRGLVDRAQEERARAKAVSLSEKEKNPKNSAC